ncbi:Pls/PosA family non-ribosomal peptide synthetase [Streptomyces sp. NPDC002055]|uniref:Pls/PosA family non-ribosomal peptide synthetase n=1 Tax=Streptomyces sp. NPDC002055 TaxID=3154534 RepID=UPI003325A239
MPRPPGTGDAPPDAPARPVREPAQGPALLSSGCEQAVRWQPGERLEQLFEDRCDRLRTADGHSPRAVDADGESLTYDRLDARANQLARHLAARGARPGDRIALLPGRAVHAYVGMLAVLKLGAVYVPLDAAFPADRLAYIVRDAGVRLVVSESALRDRLRQVPAGVVCVDEAAAELAAEDAHRPVRPTAGAGPPDDLCYIIYTSGSTGRPKGVAIPHAAVCNFVRVAAEVYGLLPQDRVYQGMTIAFDFSVEEIWVPLLVGATLVPKPDGAALVGRELGEFLTSRDVTALCCVPTLLATLDEDLPGLRFLLVSGEACPRDLVTRWHRPGRRFLNVYGPTEATVTATWTPVAPDRPVTIGVPLPTYSAVILDPAGPRALRPGELGEIGLAGVGLASGYVNRADLTDRAFIRDFLGIPNNPSGRIYRTGDLGRVNEDGEIEYHGRIDTQVKIRGYRIELSEIESVLRCAPGVAQAVVGTHGTGPQPVELVGYYVPRRDGPRADLHRIHDHLRGRLPGYMVPAYLEELPDLPRLAGGKTDRGRLPAPTGPRCLAGRKRYTPPAGPAERTLARLLAGVLHLDRVSADSDFFADLGANSLLMAQFCARVRSHGDLPPVSMRDVYLHPTVTGLAAELTRESSAPAAEAPAPAPVRPPPPAGRLQYVLCGTAQLLLFLAYTYLGAFLLIEGYQWVAAGSGLVDRYLRATVFGSAAFLLMSVVPIVVKWVLIGRWKRRDIRIWSIGYLRFWTVQTLIRLDPLVLFAGSPLYLLYLRALGARIGRGAVILSRNVPVCTDLLTVGENTLVRKDAYLACYHAESGYIRTGPVTLGRDVLISESTVLDIDVQLGDGAQLGHASSLHAAQRVPAGEVWQGSPAGPADADFRTVGPARCGTRRRVLYGTAQLLTVPFVYLPLALGAVGTLIPAFLSAPESAVSSPGFYLEQLLGSLVLFFGPLLAGLAVVTTVPRLLNRALVPGRVHPLYGFHYSVQRAVSRITNTKVYQGITGDSVFIVHYLRAVGWDLTRVVQTGSNFGVEQRQESPFLTVVGSGTMVSDGLSVINIDVSATSFRVTRAALGQDNFLGNAIAYPARSRTGDNCLLGTKVMVPVDGAVREGVGLLGSPCFEIPRSVQRDSRFDALDSGAERRLRLRAKTRHNIGTIGLFLLVRWIEFFGLVLLATFAAEHYGRYGAVVVTGATVLGLAFTLGSSVLAERAVARFRTMTPRFCSIYDPYFWWHERHWKLSMTPPFNGTPFKNLLWRLAGVRIGRRVFDDGCGMPERTLVTIGDDCTLNAGSTLQCHSLEDGTFKSGRIALGDGCTLDTATLVHYGVTMGDGAVLGPDSFLMKGEDVPPRSRWRGNPAREIRGTAGSAVPVPPPDAADGRK